MLAKAGLLGHERIAAQAALPPANAVINSVTPHSSFFPHSLSLSLLLPGFLLHTHTHRFLIPQWAVEESDSVRSCFGQWEREREAARSCRRDGRVRGGYGREGQSSVHTPTHPLLSPHRQPCWTKPDSYSIFPKLNLICSRLPLTDTLLHWNASAITHPWQQIGTITQRLFLHFHTPTHIHTHTQICSVIHRATKPSRAENNNKNHSSSRKLHFFYGQKKIIVTP